MPHSIIAYPTLSSLTKPNPAGSPTLHYLVYNPTIQHHTMSHTTPLLRITLPYAILPPGPTLNASPQPSLLCLLHHNALPHLRCLIQPHPICRTLPVPCPTRTVLYVSLSALSCPNLLTCPTPLDMHLPRQTTHHNIFQIFSSTCRQRRWGGGGGGGSATRRTRWLRNLTPHTIKHETVVLYSMWHQVFFFNMCN